MGAGPGIPPVTAWLLVFVTSLTMLCPEAVNDGAERVSVGRRKATNEGDRVVNEREDNGIKFSLPSCLVLHNCPQ